MRNSREVLYSIQSRHQRERAQRQRLQTRKIGWLGAVLVSCRIFRFRLKIVIIHGGRGDWRRKRQPTKEQRGAGIICSYFQETFMEIEPAPANGMAGGSDQVAAAANQY